MEVGMEILVMTLVGIRMSMVIARRDFQILMNLEVTEMRKVVQRANLIEEPGFLSSKHLVRPVELPWSNNHHKHLGE
jgi:hypothetical protein